MFNRSETRSVKVGSLYVGGGAPVSVQTMCNVDPHDAAKLSEQIAACAAVGCDIIRLTVPDIEAAKVFGEVRKTSPIAMVADIHFDFRCALAAIEAGADALRLNPGNIGSRENVQAVARAAKDKKIPIRIGVNAGSLERDLAAEVAAGERRAPLLVKSAMRHLKLLEDEGFRDVVISAKASNVAETVEVYRMLAETTDCPRHLGVTEAGTFLPGTVRNSVALGILLSEGIGDTVRVSLTARPEKEVRVGTEILRSLSLREPGPSITSCPTCGRTKVDLMHIASQVEIALETLAKDGIKLPHVAVMGCVVNGPGEAKGADIALCGGDGEFMIYVKGECIGKVAECDAVGKVVEHALSL
jgi:(E)-4-hydroxy-3-methylbut-2-enyl-diphosphate synthase